MIENIQEAIVAHRKELNVTITNSKDCMINKLGNGENHLMYVATIHKTKLVFRIAFREESEKKVEKEFKILQQLPKDMGPKAIFLDTSKKYIPNTYMVQSFIPGKKVKEWTKEILIEHATNIAKLHQENKQKKKCNLFNVFMERANYTLTKQPEVIEENKEIKQLFLELKEFISTHNYLITEKEYAHLIHGDLHHGNILLDHSTLHYVDWEDSRYDDNALDVATIMWFIEFDKEKYEAYITTYNEIVKDTTLEKRMMLWLLYKDFSFLLHKQWQSKDPEKRSIKQKDNFEDTIQQIINRINQRKAYFKTL